MARQQLPSQIKKLVLEDKSIRYQVTIDAGPDPATGARRQTRRRYKTEKEARAALGAAIDAVERGTFVVRSRTTVAQAMDGYLSGRRRLRVSTLRGYRDSIQPLVDRHGEMDLQKLTKKHLDLLVTDLMAGGLPRSDGKPRKPWSPRSINYMLTIIRMALESELKQGHVARNVANLVDRPEPTKKEMQTFSPDEVRILLKSVHAERNGHAWHLALIGLRRGEIGGLRWTDIDFDARTLTVGNNRVTVGGVVYENRPKTARSERTLPLTDDLLHVLRVARRWQESEKSAIPAEYGPGTHVVCDQTGRPYHPETISTYWERALQRAGLKMIRLHDARHTAGTLLHLQGVPIAVISAWLGHASASFTMATYLHSQDDALTAAGARLGVLVSLAEAPNADQR